MSKESSVGNAKTNVKWRLHKERLPRKRKKWLKKVGFLWFYPLTRIKIRQADEYRNRPSLTEILTK